MLETISIVSTSEIERFPPSSPFSFSKNFFLRKFVKEFAAKSENFYLKNFLK